MAFIHTLNMATTVISSSICKSFEPCPQLTTQVYPGCTTERLLRYVHRSAYGTAHAPQPGQRHVNLAFNDVSDGVPVDTIVGNIIATVVTLLTVNPSAAVSVSAILPRPREPERSGDIRAVNRRLKRIFGQSYISAPRSFLHHRRVKMEMFRRDGVHLSRRGTAALQSCFVNAAMHM
jgi:hypothetical protein